jgi:hypothetical protein
MSRNLNCELYGLVRALEPLIGLQLVLIHVASHPHIKTGLMPAAGLDISGPAALDSSQ